jgi:hypothetical protein
MLENSNGRRCSHVIKPIQIDNKTTKLVCVRCDTVIGWWVDKDDNSNCIRYDYSDQERELLK